MKKRYAGLGVLFGGLCALTLGAQDTKTTDERPRVVVGTFDSRAVLLAYVNSSAFQEYLAAQMVDVARATERARAAGDQALAAALDALGPEMQQRIHRQGFGTAPVGEILARIEERLPEIAKRAGVDVIVSKWTLTYRSPAAEFIDVSDLLAAEFDPSEATLKGIRKIVAQEPVPLKQLEHHEDR